LPTYISAQTGFCHFGKSLWLVNFIQCIHAWVLSSKGLLKFSANNSLLSSQKIDVVPMSCCFTN